MRPFCHQKGRRERKAPPDEGEGEQEPEGGGKEDEEDTHSGLSSRCPSCRRGYDVALLLPCSHTLCGRCILGSETRGSLCHCYRGSAHSASRSAPQPVCAVRCPCCRYRVELPCREWASAIRCLPRHPTLSPGCAGCAGCAGRGTGTEEEGASDASLGHLLDNVSCTDVGEVTEPSSSCDLVTIKVSSPTAPVDGDIDLREEEMEQSVFGLSFSLDPSSTHPSLLLSHSSLTVTFRGQTPPVPLSGRHGNGVRRSAGARDPQATLALPQVCADVVIKRGQYYWEVDVCNSALYRIGVTSLDGSGGWWLERRGLSFWAVYDGSREPLQSIPPQVKSLGLFLNMGGGGLSFHNPLTHEHLATLPTRFSPDGVLPALGLGQGRLRLRCGLSPPPHVFLSRASAYRGPCGAGGGRWRRDIPFHSVRTVIQKFEELVVSDSDSGLVSSSGSSCSNLASLPDPRPGHSPSPGGQLHCGQEGQEVGAE